MPAPQPQLSHSGRSLRYQLKAALKARQLTYAQLAAKLSVSEVTIKRWLTKQDLRYENLLKICRVLELDPLTIQSKEPVVQQRGQNYSLEDEVYFAKHPLEFLVFTKALMGFDLEQIRIQTNLSEKDLYRIFRRLEARKLLSLAENGKIRMKVEGPFRWRPAGPLEKTYSKDFQQVILNQFRDLDSVIDHPTENDITVFRPFEFYLDDESATEMSQEFARLVMKYRFLSHKNVKKWKNKRPVAGLVAIRNFDAWLEVYLSHSVRAGKPNRR